MTKKQPWLIKLMIGVLGAIFLIAFLLSVYYSSQTLFVTTQSNASQNDRLHFASVLVGNETYFYDRMEEGMLSEATAIDADIEHFRTQTVDEAADILEMLVSAQVDGIVTQGIQNTRFKEAFEKVSDAKIPMILVGADNQIFSSSGYVGSNPFEGGALLASALLKNNMPRGKVILITNTVNDVDENMNNKLQIQGFLDSFERVHLENRVIVVSSDASLLSAEGIVSDLFLKETNIEAIVCTNEIDTIGVAQVVVDLNKVGKVTVIGTGLTRQIIDYLDKGIIDSSLYRNPEFIGESAIKLLNQSFNDDKQEWHYQNVESVMVNSDNIDAYRELVGDQ